MTIPDFKLRGKGAAAWAKCLRLGERDPSFALQQNSLQKPSRPASCYIVITHGNKFARPETDEAVLRNQLLDAFLVLKTRAEAEAFLADLCTPGEIRAFVERLHVAALLDEDALSYREIAELAGASTTTVVRIARFLREMPFQGYRLVLDRLKKK